MFLYPGTNSEVGCAPESCDSLNLPVSFWFASINFLHELNFPIRLKGAVDF
jgi:hypothetical protein